MRHDLTRRMRLSFTELLPGVTACSLLTRLGLEFLVIEERGQYNTDIEIKKKDLSLESALTFLVEGRPRQAANNEDKQDRVPKSLFLLRIELQSLIPWPGNWPSIFLGKENLQYVLPLL